MMRLVQLAFFVSLIATPAVAEEGTCLDALQKRFPGSDVNAVKAAAAWLEDNFGAATAEDLKGVSNFAVDAMSLAGADASLRPDTKRILQRLFKSINEVDAKPEAGPKNPLEVLQQTFPDSVSGNVLQTVAKWLEDNFGATTAEDMDGVSDWAVNAMTLVKGDGRLGSDEKHILQRFLQISQERRMMSHMGGSSSSMMMSSSKKPTTTTTMKKAMPTSSTTTTTVTMKKDDSTTTSSTTVAKKDDSGDSKKETTTTTTTMAAVATTTTTMKAAVATTTVMAGTKFNGQITFDVSDIFALLNDLPKAKLVMKDALAHANPEIPSADHVTINSITQTLPSTDTSGGRRLTAGGVLVDYTVTLPASYSGPGITSANFDTTKLKDKVTNNAHGVAVTVTKATITKAPTCAAGGASCPKPATTTVKMTTTEKDEKIGGAVTAQQLATSVAAMLLVKLLSGL